MIRYILLAVAIFTVFLARPAEAHFFGATKDVDGYQVVFQPSPQAPVVNNDSILNFSILQNNSNIYNVYSALKISEKSSGKIIHESQERWYETSDISIPYNFETTGDYILTLETRIIGDEKYESSPLIASFDLSVGLPGVPFDELMLYYVTPGAVAVTGISVYLRSKKML